MKILRSFGIVAGLTLIGSFLGYVRDAALAASFGASTTTDAYFAAFFVPNTLYLILLSNSVAIVFLPIFVETFQKDEEDAWETASALFNISLLVLSAVVLVAAFSARYWMPVLYAGFSESTMQLALTLNLILLPMLIFIGLSTLLTAILNSFGHFAVPAFAPVLANLIVIVAIFLSNRFWGIAGVAVAVTVSALVQLLIQIPVLRHFNSRYTFTLELHNPAILRVFRLAIPLIIYFAIAYASQAVERNIASSLVEGTVSAVSYAANLFRVPIAIFAGSLGTVIYPRLSLEAANQTNDLFSSSMMRAIGATTMFLLPLSCWMLINSQTIINVLFGYGRFSAEDVQLTAIILAGYAIGMTANGITRILQRSFYALQDTVTPVFVEIASFALYGGLVFFLVRWSGALGLGVARSAYFLLVAVLSFWLLKRHPEISFDKRGVALMFGRYLLASLAASLLWYGLAQINNGPFFPGRVGAFAYLALSGLAGAALFGILAHLLKADEVRLLAGRSLAFAGRFASREKPDL